MSAGLWRWRHAIVRQTDDQWVAAFVLDTGLVVIIYRHGLDGPFDVYPREVASRFIVLAEYASAARSDYLVSEFGRSPIAFQLRYKT